MDGRSKRQRFIDEQKRATVQEKERPGDADGACLPPHGIATSQLFRWRVQFGLIARKTPQLAKVILADGRRDGAASSPCAAALYRKAAACDGAQFGHSAEASHVAPMLDVGSSPEP